MICDFDVCAKATGERERQMLLSRAYGLGWDMLAWSSIINASQLAQTQAQAQGGGRQNIKGNRANAGLNLTPLAALKLDKIETRKALVQRCLVVPEAQAAALGASSGSGSKLPLASEPKQLSRITLVLDNPLDLHCLTTNASVIAGFDLLAVRPTSTRAFGAVCSAPEVFLVSLDLSRKMFTLPSKALEAAAKRSCCFEINCAPLLNPNSTAGARREALAGGRALLLALRSTRNRVVLSSGAEAVSGLRGPAELCSVGKTLGLSAAGAAFAVRQNPATVLRLGRERRERNQPLQLLQGQEFRCSEVYMQGQMHVRVSGASSSSSKAAVAAVADHKRKRHVPDSGSDSGSSSGSGSDSGSGSGSDRGSDADEEEEEDEEEAKQAAAKKQKLAADSYDLAF